MFYSWLYTGRLIDPVRDRDLNDKIAMLARTWIFGDDMGIPSLQNDAMDEIVSLNIAKWDMPCRDHITLIWENTTEGAPLREFFIDYTASSDRYQIVDYLAAERTRDVKPLHPEFIRELAVVLANDTWEQMGQDEWKKFDKTGYHVNLDAKAKK